MVKNIGVDLVDVSEIRRLRRDLEAFTFKTFTKREIEASKSAADTDEYFASRFAVKEAVFKTISKFLKDKSFDFRCVETLNDDFGAPFVNITPELEVLMKEAGFSEFLLSISTEKEYVIAFVIGQ